MSDVTPGHSQDPAPQPPQQQWAWAQRRVPTLVETEPLEYHRLLRGMKRYRWWKPLLLLLISGAIYGLLSVGIGAIWMVLIFAKDPSLLSGGALEATVMSELMLDTQNPLSVLMNLLSVILMIPAVMLGMLIMGMRPVGRVWSAAARIRWGLVGRTLAISVLAIVVTNVLGIAIGIAIDPSAASSEASTTPDIDVRAALISFVIVLLLVPLQATAEEVAFRGMLMQIIGSWLRNPWYAILIPSVLFAVAHIYDIWGMLVVGLMGVAAAWLTWRTGGLEAAMSIHIVNNLIAFGVLSSGVTGETGQTVEGAGLASVISQALGLALYVWLVVRTFRKHGYGRTRVDNVEVLVDVEPHPPLGSSPEGQGPTRG